MGMSEKSQFRVFQPHWIFLLWTPYTYNIYNLWNWKLFFSASRANISLNFSFLSISFLSRKWGNSSFLPCSLSFYLSLRPPRSRFSSASSHSRVSWFGPLPEMYNMKSATAIFAFHSLLNARKLCALHLFSFSARIHNSTCVLLRKFSEHIYTIQFYCHA